MRKILFLMAMTLTVFACNTSKAQTTTPRIGNNGTTADNTFRTLSSKYNAVTEAAGFDSVVPYTRTYLTDYKVTLAADSLRFGVPVVTKAYYGDVMRIYASGSSGTKITFSSAMSLYQTAGTATLSTGGKAIIVLMFDGVKWVEQSRVVQ